MTPQRPILRWHGGKWLLAPWIVAQFPPHRIYVEPYGGAASVLLQKPRAFAEIYNDLDDDAVTLFGVMREADSAARLRELLALTPFARKEFELAYQPHDDPVERSRRLLIRSFMGFGSDGHNAEIKTGFRANSDRAGTTPAHDWRNLPSALEAVTARLQGVVIEHRPAIAVMAARDREDALHYVDPPYLPETRSRKSRRGKVAYHAYRHEMTRDEHAELLAFLRTLSGAVIISGYHSSLYDEVLCGWRRLERRALADGARPRTEVLWMNEACLSRESGPLFAAQAKEAAE